MRMEKNIKKLFSIGEAAHACGLSRSTLMRMEEKGLLVPAYIAPDSGRRYYDNHNMRKCACGQGIRPEFPCSKLCCPP